MTFFFLPDPGFVPTRRVARQVPLAKKEIPAPEARQTLVEPLATPTVAEDPVGTCVPVISAIWSAVRLTPTAGVGWAGADGVVDWVGGGGVNPAGSVTFGCEKPGSSPSTLTAGAAAGFVADALFWLTVAGGGVAAGAAVVGPAVGGAAGATVGAAVVDCRVVVGLGPICI